MEQALLVRPARFRVSEELAGRRLSQAVTQTVEGLSARAAKRLIDRGRVFLDERRALKASLPVRKGEVVEVFADRTERSVSLEPESVVYQSSGFVALNKPAGLTVYGARGASGDTLLPQLQKLLQPTEETGAWGALQLVHRLDRDTSGLILVARNKEILRFLEKQFLHREIRKLYRVLVRGNPAEDSFSPGRGSAVEKSARNRGRSCRIRSQGARGNGQGQPASCYRVSCTGAVQRRGPS